MTKHMKVRHVLQGISTASLERENGVYILKLKKKIIPEASAIGNISIVSDKGLNLGF